MNVELASRYRRGARDCLCAGARGTADAAHRTVCIYHSVVSSAIGVLCKIVISHGTERVKNLQQLIVDGSVVCRGFALACNECRNRLVQVVCRIVDETFFGIRFGLAGTDPRPHIVATMARQEEITSAIWSYRDREVKFAFVCRVGYGVAPVSIGYGTRGRVWLGGGGVSLWRLMVGYWHQAVAPGQIEQNDSDHQQTDQYGDEKFVE